MEIKTKRLEKKLDGNYTRMLRAILNKSWQQHPTKRQLYDNLPPITKTIQARRTRHAGHCWRSKDEIVRDVLLWTPTYGQSKAGRPARTYIQQLCEDTGCNPEDLPEAMNDRETWRERVRDIRASRTIWWYIYIYIHEVIKVEGDAKASFSITTTPRCEGGCDSITWISPLILDPYIIMLSIKQEDIMYHFLSLWYDSTWDWNPVSQASGEHYNHDVNWKKISQYVLKIDKLFVCTDKKSLMKLDPLFVLWSIHFPTFHTHTHTHTHTNPSHIYIYIYNWTDSL